MTNQRPHNPRLNGSARPTRSLGTPGARPPRRREACAPDLSYPPHAWDCPVVMKMDPGSVAWTCANCGSIVTVPVGSPRPPGAAPPSA
jgi:hypothetical protein